MSNAVDDFVLLVKDQIAQITGELKVAKGVLAFIKLVPFVLRVVESVALSGAKVPSDQKKEAAVRIINDLIDLPYLPDWIEGKVIGLVIDAVISGFNTLFGKLWLSKAEPIAPPVMP